MSFYLIRSSAPVWDSWSQCQEPPSLANLMCFLSPFTGSHVLWEHLRCEPHGHIPDCNKTRVGLSSVSIPLIFLSDVAATCAFCLAFDPRALSSILYPLWNCQHFLYEHRHRSPAARAKALKRMLKWELDLPCRRGCSCPCVWSLGGPAKHGSS